VAQGVNFISLLRRKYERLRLDLPNIRPRRVGGDKLRRAP
jgi:hypothetical protein